MTCVPCDYVYVYSGGMFVWRYDLVSGVIVWVGENY